MKAADYKDDGKESFDLLKYGTMNWNKNLLCRDMQREKIFFLASDDLYDLCIDLGKL